MGLFNFIDDRMGLMANMISSTDADLTHMSPNNLEQQFRTATFRCMNCKNVEECKHWLSEGHQHSAAPDFCPNSEMINSIRER